MLKSSSMNIVKRLFVISDLDHQRSVNAPLICSCVLSSVRRWRVLPLRSSPEVWWQDGGGRGTGVYCGPVPGRVVGQRAGAGARNPAETHQKGVHVRSNPQQGKEPRQTQSVCGLCLFSFSAGGPHSPEEQRCPRGDNATWNFMLKNSV